MDTANSRTDSTWALALLAGAAALTFLGHNPGALVFAAAGALIAIIRAQHPRTRSQRAAHSATIGNLLAGVDRAQRRRAIRALCGQPRADIQLLNCDIQVSEKGIAPTVVRFTPTLTLITTSTPLARTQLAKSGSWTMRLAHHPGNLTFLKRITTSGHVDVMLTVGWAGGHELVTVESISCGDINNSTFTRYDITHPAGAKN